MRACSKVPASFFLLMAWLALAPPLVAQDRFGAAVTVANADEVIVLKAGAAIGPAAAVVFRLGSDGEWAQTERLSKLGGGYPGEALLPELTAGGGFLLLGSGDPEGREAGHLYERAGNGWSPRLRVPLDPSNVLPELGLPVGGLDMSTLNRLMGPPARHVALSPDGRRLAVSGGAIEPGTVHVLAHEGGRWTLEAALRSHRVAPGGATTFGSALVIGGGRLIVGAPGDGPGGEVHIFEHDGSAWMTRAVFAADPADADGALGSALALSANGTEVYASAPGLDRVLQFASGSDGWLRSQELAPSGVDRTETIGFGVSLALDGDRLLVGAPLANQNEGRAYVFDRSTTGWTLDRTLTADGLGQADFGGAVALRGDRALVGAPGAFGNEGRAAVFDLEAGGEPAWLEPRVELARVTGADPVVCADGAAAGYDCEGVDLVSFLPLSALGGGPGERVTDVWGWTDPMTGREYALVGRTAGLAFVDIANPGAPRLVGLMPANPSHARDIKVYRDHAFMTGDGAGDHGLLVFDLTRLRDFESTPATADPAEFEPDARYDEVASAHNLVIDTESGFAYTVGTNTGGQSCGGGLHMIDIRDPLQPTFAGCFTDTTGLIWTGRTHDAQCTVYRGPDEDYQGRQICFASNETAMRIVDVTDKSAPRPISTASHPGTAYVHQGWLTEDHRYLYVNDELDEIVGTTDRTRTLIYDVAELDDPILVGEHLGPDNATDHNLYITGSRAYLANYQAGFRVLDVSDPEHPVEIGWFDTTPYGENPPGFGGGAWTAWPFFESGMVVVSSMNEGLFILRPQRPVT